VEQSKNARLPSLHQLFFLINIPTRQTAAAALKIHWRDFDAKIYCVSPSRLSLLSAANCSLSFFAFNSAKN